METEVVTPELPSESRRAVTTDFDCAHLPVSMYSVTPGHDIAEHMDKDLRPIDMEAGPRSETSTEQAAAEQLYTKVEAQL